MRRYHPLTAVLLFFILMATMGGCGRQSPLSPEYGLAGNDDVADRPLQDDEGAWQTVDLICCQESRGMIFQEDPTGQLRYHVSQDLVFEGQIQVRDLLPDYEYLLSIVGQPDMPGSPDEYYRAGVVYYDMDAPEPYTGMPTQPGGSRGGEEYCDFALVMTDQYGGIQESFHKSLPAGLYEVTFFVKDAHLWSHYAETGNFDTEIMYQEGIEYRINTQLQQSIQ